MSSAPPITRASNRFKLLLLVLLVTVAAIAIFAVIAVVVILFGSVRGTEFSPQTFHRRTYQFWQIPLIRLKVSGITREDTTGPLETHLVSSKLIPTLPQPTQWDLVTKQIGLGAEQVNDPQVLVNYLEMEEAGGYLVWMRWSEDHPQYAKVFWPVIARVVQDNLYVHLPQFFRIARTAEDAQKFAQDLTAAELKLRRDLAARWEARGQKDLAKAHYEQALKLAPEDAALQAKVKELGSAS